MTSKSTECWATEPQARAVRVEPVAGHSFILPYLHFVYAELTGHGHDQTLKLVFATHEVILRGRALRRVEAAVHRLELSWVAPLTERVRATVPDGQPFIHEICVTAVTETEEKRPSQVEEGS